jgi:hypothetical protein
MSFLINSTLECKCLDVFGLPFPCLLCDDYRIHVVLRELFEPRSSRTGACNAQHEDDPKIFAVD